MNEVPEKQTTTDEIRDIINSIIQENNDTLLAMFRKEMNSRLEDLATKNDLDASNKRIRDVEQINTSLERRFEIIPQFMKTMQDAFDNLSSKLDMRDQTRNLEMKNLREIMEAMRDSMKARDDSVREIRDDLNRLEDVDIKTLRADIETNKHIIDDTNKRSAQATSALWGSEEYIGLPVIPMVRNHEGALTTMTTMLTTLTNEVRVINAREEARIEARQQMIANGKAVVKKVAVFAMTPMGAAVIGGGGLSIAALIEFLKAILGG